MPRCRADPCDVSRWRGGCVCAHCGGGGSMWEFRNLLFCLLSRGCVHIWYMYDITTGRKTRWGVRNGAGKGKFEKAIYLNWEVWKADFDKHPEGLLWLWWEVAARLLFTARCYGQASVSKVRTVLYVWIPYLFGLKTWRAWIWSPCRYSVQYVGRSRVFLGIRHFRICVASVRCDPAHLTNCSQGRIYHQWYNIPSWNQLVRSWEWAFGPTREFPGSVRIIRVECVTFLKWRFSSHWIEGVCGV